MLASKIIKDASVILMDIDMVRWPVAELAGWIDQGVLSIILAKPSASSRTYIMSPLAAGTKQMLPETVEDEKVRQLLDVIRNIGAGNVGGRAIRSVSRAEVDGNMPDWHNPAKLPFQTIVKHFIFDEMVPREFYVVPGNNGSGSIEIAIATVPQTVLERVVAEQDQIASYDIEVGIGDEYEPALLDYVLYRAFSKEEPSASPQRAVTHYQAFATALGIQSQVESATSPGKKR